MANLDTEHWYCTLGSRPSEFAHFYRKRHLVEMCGYPPHEILEVQIRPARHRELPNCYGWFCAEANRLTLIYPREFQLEMCFPYGMAVETARGKGYPVPLIAMNLGVGDEE